MLVLFRKAAVLARREEKNRSIFKSKSMLERSRSAHWLMQFGPDEHKCTEIAQKIKLFFRAGTYLGPGVFHCFPTQVELFNRELCSAMVPNCPAPFHALCSVCLRQRLLFLFVASLDAFAEHTSRLAGQRAQRLCAFGYHFNRFGGAHFLNFCTPGP